MSENVKLLKLVTGEEIICDLVSAGSTDTTLKMPYLLKFANGVSFVPWTVGTLNCVPATTYTLKTSAIIMTNDPYTSLEEKYLEKISEVD